MNNTTLMNDEQLARELAKRLDTGHIYPKETDDPELYNLLETYSRVASTSNNTARSSHQDELAFAHKLQKKLMQQHRDAGRQNSIKFPYHSIRKISTSSMILIASITMFIILTPLVWMSIFSNRVIVSYAQPNNELSYHIDSPVNPKIFEAREAVIWVWENQALGYEVSQVSNDTYRIRLVNTRIPISASQDVPSLPLVLSSPDANTYRVTVTNVSERTIYLTGCFDENDRDKPLADALDAGETKLVICPK